MHIELNGQLYENRKVKMRDVRNALKIMETPELVSINKVEDLDKIVSFVVDLYDDQFTIDEFYDGADGGKPLVISLGIVEKVIKGLFEATETKND